MAHCGSPTRSEPRSCGWIRHRAMPRPSGSRANPRRWRSRRTAFGSRSLRPASRASTRRTSSVTLTQSVGSGPTAVLSAFGSIWVANHFDGTVSRLEPSTGRVQATISVAEGPNSLGAAAGLPVGRERVRRLDHRHRPDHGYRRASRPGGWRASVDHDRRRWPVARRRSIGRRAPRRDPDRLFREKAPTSLDPASLHSTTRSRGRSWRSRTTGSCLTTRSEAPAARRWSRTWPRRSPRCPPTD